LGKDSAISHLSPPTSTLAHQRWLSAIKAGRTFVTNAPLLDFQITGPDAVTHQPGDEIRLSNGHHELEVRVILRANVPVDHLELIGNGGVVASMPLSGDRMAADTTVTISVEQSGWYLLRAWSDRPQLPVLDLYAFASTSPIYVQVGAAPVRSRADAEYFLTWLRRVDEAVRAHTAWNTPAERDAAMQTVAAARAEFERRAAGR
jgi:hypothetical protein